MAEAKQPGYVAISEAAAEKLAKMFKGSEDEDLAKLAQTLADIKYEDGDAETIEAAREEYGDEGQIEIDDNAIVSKSEAGAYVQAWVWMGA